MRILSGSLVPALALLLASTALGQSRPLGAVDADRIRIRAHLERVEAALRATDVSHLSPEQRRARAQNLDRLRAYRLRGEFPHGHAGQPGPRVPTFIDADGRACAMGHLVIESGHGEAAEAIALAQNHARVPEITHPALGPWLEANGMTLEEATLVQPSYCHECADAGSAPVCGSDGNVYSSECLAQCEGIPVSGPAQCDGDACTCGDAGTPEDAGAGGDSDAMVGRVDGGGGAVAPRSDGCSAGGGVPGSLPAVLLTMIALLGWRRRAR